MTHSQLTSRVIEPEELTPKEIRQWNKLLRESPVPTAFLSPSYAQCANKCFGNTRVCVISRDDVLVAFFPFCFETRTRRFLGSASPVGGRLTDYVGIISSQDLHITPAKLLELSAINAFSFTHLDESQQYFGITGDQPRVGLRAVLKNCPEQFLQTLFSKKTFRKSSRKRLRQLEREHGKLQFVATLHPSHEDIDHLIDLKIDQYRRTKQINYPFKQHAERQFLHTLARESDSECGTLLTKLFAGEHLIAMRFGLIYEGNFAAWFPVYDTAFREFSPGTLLTIETIRQAQDLGITCIDFGEGDTQAKRDFANEEHTYLRGYYHRRNVSAVIDACMNSLRWRLGALRNNNSAD